MRLLYMLRVNKLHRFFFGFCFPAYVFTKEWEAYFAFGADDLTQINGFAFGYVKAPGAVYHHLIFKTNGATNMVVSRGVI